MAIVPLDQLPNENSNVVPLENLPAGETPKNSKQTFRGLVASSLKQSARNVVGQGISEFVPGLESNIIKRGAETGMKMGKDISDNAGIPETPNKNFKVGGMEGNINPNSVASTVIGGLLDPRSLAGMRATPLATEEVGMSIMQKTARPGQMMMKSKQALNEAEKIAAQVLQPTISELSDAIASGKTLPSIKRGAEAITASRSYDELVGSLKNTTGELFKERNSILETNNVQVGNQMLESLSEFTNVLTKSRRYSPKQLKVLDEVASRETQYLAENPTMDVLKAQARKEELQTFTQPLLDKRKAGTITGRENMELQAYDALRAGYRKAILKALPEDKRTIVDKINSKYEGMVEATELAARRAAGDMKSTPEGLLGALSRSFGLSPKFTAFRIALRKVDEVARRKELINSTTQIQRLRQNAELLGSLARAAQKRNR